MRLLSAVVGFLLRKAGVFVAILVSLFLVVVVTSAVIPPLKEALADQDRLDAVVHDRERLEHDLDGLKAAYEEGQTKAIDSLVEEVEVEVEEARQKASESRADLKHKRENQDEICGLFADLASKVLPGSGCDRAKEAVEKADDAVNSIERNLAEAERDRAVLADPDLTPAEKLDRLGEDGGQAATERRIENTEADLSQKKAEEESLQEAQASWAGWLVRLWAQSWKWLAAIALVVLVLPLLLRCVSYFVLMPWVRRAHKPFRLAGDSDDPAACLQIGTAERTLTVRLAAGEMLSVRSEHVRSVQGKARSYLLYDWGAPFISFAAGLAGLSRLEGDETGAQATLASSEDPDSYLMRIDFENHPGIAMRPTHVVGVIGAPKLETKWRWGIHALATWQVRYVLFTGTGSLIVEGCGDIRAETPGQRAARMDQNLTMGFDSRLTVGVNRTETFLPYLRGIEPLVDDEFTGAHAYFWQKSTTAGSSSPIARVFDAFFSAFGKLLGF